MTYGISLKNEFDENLTDQSQGTVFYKKSGGTCILPSAVPFDTNLPSARTKWIYPSDLRGVDANGALYHLGSGPGAPNWLYNEKINFASTGFRQIAIRQFGAADKTSYWPDPVSTNPNDLVFFRMPSEGIMSLAQVWIPFTGADFLGRRLVNGLHAWCAPFYTHDGSALQYRIISTDLPPAPTENFGLVIYDVNGTKLLLDTRREVASFVDHIEISSAVAQNIIINNAVVIHTLRRPISNAWMASEGAGGMAYRWDAPSKGITTLSTLRIRQISSTQIRIDRGVTSGQTNNNFSNTVVVQDFPDALFLIGDLD